MVGFFDSGFGGLTVLKEVVKTLPEYSCIYLGDNARTPYGSRSQDVIYQYTIEGVDELFRQGTELVILACNTASAVALRRLQREWLPVHYPEKRVLGVLNPTVEEIKNFDCKTVGLFATQATVKSQAFVREIAKIDSGAVVIQQACPLLVPIIESGEFDQLEVVTQKYVQELFAKRKDIGTVILGCTHYAIIANIFRKYVPQHVRIISQGELVATSLRKYLARHIEIENRLSKNGEVSFLTTKSSPHVQYLAKMFYGKKIKLEVVSFKSGS